MTFFLTKHLSFSIQDIGRVFQGWYSLPDALTVHCHQLVPHPLKDGNRGPPGPQSRYEDTHVDELAWPQPRIISPAHTGQMTRMVATDAMKSYDTTCYQHRRMPASRHIIDGWYGGVTTDTYCKPLLLVNQPNCFGLKFPNYQTVNHKMWVFQILVKWYFCIFMSSGFLALPMTNLNAQQRSFHSLKAKKLTQIWTCLRCSWHLENVSLAAFIPPPALQTCLT